SPITTTPSIATVASTARIPSTAPWSADSFCPRPTQRAPPIAPASVTRTSSSARFRSGARLLTSAPAPAKPAPPLLASVRRAYRSCVQELHLVERARLVVAGVARLPELAHALRDDGLHRGAALLQVRARVELARRLGEHLPHGARHRKAEVGVDVDLA